LATRDRTIESRPATGICTHRPEQSRAGGARSVCGPLRNRWTGSGCSWPRWK